MSGVGPRAVGAFESSGALHTKIGSGTRTLGCGVGNLLLEGSTVLDSHSFILPKISSFCGSGESYQQRVRPTMAHVAWCEWFHYTGVARWHH